MKLKTRLYVSIGLLFFLTSVLIVTASPIVAYVLAPPSSDTIVETWFFTNRFDTALIVFFPLITLHAFLTSQTCWTIILAALVAIAIRYLVYYTDSFTAVLGDSHDMYSFAVFILISYIILFAFVVRCLYFNRRRLLLSQNDNYA